MDDLFGGVTFPDVKLDAASVEKILNEGNPGTPSPGNQGQPFGSPPDTGGNTPSNPPAGEDTVVAPKPPPYDQDPKWKAARAAEATLQDLLQEHGFLNTEELKQALAQGQTLKQALGDKDPKQLLESASKLEKINQHWSTEEEQKKRQTETAEQTLARLEKDHQKTQREFAQYKESVESKQVSERLIAQYNTDINAILGMSETPISDHERQLITQIMAVDNPIIDVDINDRRAVRETAKTVLGKVQGTLQSIKQAAIDEYVAGKSKYTPGSRVSAPAQEPAKPATAATATQKPMSVDDTFALANQELLEIVGKGLAAMN